MKIRYVGYLVFMFLAGACLGGSAQAQKPHYSLRYRGTQTWINEPYIKVGFGSEGNLSSSDMSFKAYLGLRTNVSWGFYINPVHGFETSLQLGVHPYANKKYNRLGQQYISPTFSSYIGIGGMYSFNYTNYKALRQTLSYWEYIGLVGTNLKFAKRLSFDLSTGFRIQANPSPSFGIYVEPIISLSDNQLDVHESEQYKLEFRPSISAGFVVRIDDHRPNSRIRFYDRDIRYLPTRLTPDVSLKTNLLFWAMGTPNIGIEIPVGKKFSIATGYTFPWFKNRVAGYTYQLIAGELEGRYWFDKHTSMQGHFVGLYTGAGYYDFQSRSKGFQGEFYIASGVEYGFVLPLSNDFAIETSVGVGYLSTHYREYEPDEGCLVYQSTKATSYFGPTKLNIGLIWRIAR